MFRYERIGTEVRIATRPIRGGKMRGRERYSEMEREDRGRGGGGGV